MKLIWNLLKQHISYAQLVGFFFANLFGMTIVLLGVQFYRDIAPVFSSEDSFMQEDYIVVTRKVSTLGSLVGGAQGFSDADVDDLRKQPFTKDVGAFQASRFKVVAGMGFQGMNMSTAMFFESVPDAFVDVVSDKWTFTPGTAIVPIILPRNYLNLYNFGFARSRNLPQLSEGVLGMIRLDIRIAGNGSQDVLKGQIVGFSDRLNTILVPEAFMKWANEKYGERKAANPSRLILEVQNKADERIAQYFQKKGYETEDNKLDTGKTTWFLKLIMGIVLLVGLFISLLSFYILILSVYLLLQKNTVKLENLLLIGYSPSQVALPYQLLSIVLNALVLLLSVVLVWVCRCSYLQVLESLLPSGLGGGLWSAVLVGLMIFIGVSVFNWLAIRKKVIAIWYNNNK